MSEVTLLRTWIIEALVEMEGSAPMIEVAKLIWHKRSSDLAAHGDLFFRWQYVMRWSATSLRKDGILRPAEECEKGVWVLKMMSD
jgi:hypothetical protein